MISQVFGAVVRAFLMALLVITPAMLLPGVGGDTAQVMLLFALFAGLLTFIEYSTRYPGIVEFRYAPPYNRIRFLTLFTIVALLGVMLRGQSEPSTLSLLIEALGTLIGEAMDFPYSPVRLVTLMLPPQSSPEHVATVRAAAGLSYLASLFMLIVFVCTLRIRRWPTRREAFNVWVNLPTFDPTAGGDAVARLDRSAVLNIALGFLLPFLIPAAIMAASTLLQPIFLREPQTLIWTIAAWAFLPASLLMRGVAIGRIARMIRDKRRSNGEAAAEEWQLA